MTDFTVKIPQDRMKQEAPTRSYDTDDSGGMLSFVYGVSDCVKMCIDGVDGGSWGFFAAGVGLPDRGSGNAFYWW